MYNQLVSLLSASIRFILETILNQWYRFFYTDYQLPFTNYHLPITNNFKNRKIPLANNFVFNEFFCIIARLAGEVPKWS